MIKLRERLKLTLQKLDKPYPLIVAILTASWSVAIILVLLILTGCAYFEKPQPAIPANLAAPCPDVAPFEGRTLGELMSYTVELIGQYHECQARMDAVDVWANRA